MPIYSPNVRKTKINVQICTLIALPPGFGGFVLILIQIISVVEFIHQVDVHIDKNDKDKDRARCAIQNPNLKPPIRISSKVSTSRMPHPKEIKNQTTSRDKTILMLDFQY